LSFTLKQIRYFVAAAEAGQISRAAIELNVAQSAVTTAVRQLEETPVFSGPPPVSGDGLYEYDPLYRLRSATGREHPGLAQPTEADTPFGTVVRPLEPFRQTLAVVMLWSPLPERWDRDEHATSNPYPLNLELLRRGQNRFNIYCAPCHSALGDGDGYIVRRGFPAPPSYHINRLREAPDRHFFDVMTQGYGIMYSYADRLTPADRWAIVGFIRALQLSQHAPAAALDRDAAACLDRASK